MDRCEKCNEFIYSSVNHKCNPVWHCQIIDGSEEFDYKVYAYDEGTAAEKFAEERESDWDYSFVDNGGVEVDVKNPETGEIKRFYVWAEVTIVYTASEK